MTARAGRQEANSPRNGTLYQTASRLPVANQVFLGSWEVDICQEGRIQSSDPQRRHMAHLRLCSHSATGKLLGQDRGGDKTYCTPGECALTKHLVG